MRPLRLIPLAAPTVMRPLPFREITSPSRTSAAGRTHSQWRRDTSPASICITACVRDSANPSATIVSNRMEATNIRSSSFPLLPTQPAPTEALPL